ncbi:hypothetical protein [Alkalibacillus salilacus]|uniref:Uncharacterized protein n=1 Tax=Alkalibacillus salilacus TaxID=284582 RepID=A0ABT9VF35_9BACI|nr:hypothetical protein [Alkalibacillus salilacus]MDQ0159470.1 hypothetical protein [Alkalibacillus salilacus]
MNKKGMLIVFGFIIVVIAGFAVAGGIVESSKNTEPYFTGEYNIGPDGRIAYVMETDGRQTLYVKGPDAKRIEVYTAEESKELWSPVFNDNGDFSVIETTGYPEAPPGEQEFQLEHSDVHTISAEGGDIETVLQARGVITDLVKDPAQMRWIINGIHLSTEGEPEEGFKPYASGLYTLKPNGNFEEIQSFETYSPSSLSIADNGKRMLMVLPDDYENATPDSMFESVERIYEMNIEKPEEMKVISNKNSEVPISEVVWMEDQNKLLYQTIMNYGEDGLYEYDMVSYDRASGKEGDRLRINDSVQHAKLSRDNTLLYYVKEKSEANQSESYELFRYHLDNGEEEKIELSP